MVRLMIDDLYPTMPWDEIDAVVFDVGRVLLDFQPKTILERYMPERPDLHPVLMRRMFQSPYWAMRDRGIITLEEAHAAMCTGHPEIAGAVHTILDKWGEMKDVIGEGVDAMRLCKQMGKRVYILSNYADEAFAVAEGKYDFFDLADARFVSSRLQMMKPEMRIYDHVVQATGHDPARMLFVDDTPGNIEAALYAGWQGICYNEPGKLARFFTA